MPRRISKRIGFAKNVGMVYEALKEIKCSRCGAIIKPGDHFTRPSCGYNRTAPACSECQTFREG